jgi:hypothetical protein
VVTRLHPSHPPSRTRLIAATLLILLAELLSDVSWPAPTEVF